MTHNKPSHQDLPCLLFGSGFFTDIHICNNGHVQIQRWKSPLQKLMDERLKDEIEWMKRKGQNMYFACLQCMDATKLIPCFKTARANSKSPDQPAQPCNLVISLLFLTCTNVYIALDKAIFSSLMHSLI